MEFLVDSRGRGGALSCGFHSSALRVLRPFGRKELSVIIQCLSQSSSSSFLHLSRGTRPASLSKECPLLEK